MTTPSACTWSTWTIQAFAAAGLRRWVCCPGNRNAPLLLAIADREGLSHHVHRDERAAAFAALGMSVADGEPTGICVTSGSAVAHCLPALTEAAARGLPLLLLSGDRPWEWQDSGAPQTMDQTACCSGFASVVDVGEPAAGRAAAASLVHRIAWAVHRCRSGPVHVNLRLRDPLFDDGSIDPLPTSTPQIADAPRRQATPLSWPAHGGSRGLIIAGPQCPVDASTLARIIDQCRWPVIADACSGVRHPDVAGLITTADALCQRLGDRAAPDAILQLGDCPLARTTYTWLDRWTAPRCVATTGDSDRDWLHRADLVLPAVDTDTLLALSAGLAPAEPSWRDLWNQAESAARRSLSTDERWDEATAVRLTLADPEHEWLIAANSLSVRLVNLLRSADNRPCYANRGVNGIDGTLSTALGIATVRGDRGLVILGDIATLHDANALCALDDAPPLTVLILNNHGGAIFDHLPVARRRSYRRLVRADHGIDFASWARWCGADYHHVTDTALLTQALSARGHRHRIIEACFDDDGGASWRRRLHEAATGCGGNAHGGTMQSG